ncbi:hypothetical protein EYB45_10255 [Erythrobacteraceae bacterium CFH 75059]|nr:hypothetical protein EYB45_10255 [Erythrobacteraceae bacterium CFH 75059]
MWAGAAALALSACGTMGQSDQTSPFSGIGPDETVRMIGTEPFWNASVQGDTLTYTTPDTPAGSTARVRRFAGNNGLSFSGTLDGAALDVVLTAAPCSDGMSDRRYPFTVTLKLGTEQRAGCGWSDRTPFSGPAAP